jgi:hypothetical protein
VKWLTPIIPATRVADIRRNKVEGSPGTRHGVYIGGSTAV